MEKNKQKTLEEISFAFSKEFPRETIKWRVGRKGDPGTAYALAYITSRDVMNRLDEVVGMENWQCKHIAYGPKTICHIGIKIKGEWVWKSDGAGDSNFEPEKGGISDSLKRAAVQWGIGRYLYDFPKIWAKTYTSHGQVNIDTQDAWHKYDIEKGGKQ
tara:strand:- start:270 stop:743 length:474 start_codon:yes stop_codon:yes gene_type:complete